MFLQFPRKPFVRIKPALITLMGKGREADRLFNFAGIEESQQTIDRSVRVYGFRKDVRVIRKHALAHSELSAGATCDIVHRRGEPCAGYRPARTRTSGHRVPETTR